MTAIGIDLGTTNSCVAVWRHNKVEIIANDLGHRTTPSCVSFDTVQRYVGSPAVMQKIKHPKNTVFEIKRLLGRNFDDPEVRGDIQRWPFTVVDDEGKPMIQVEYKKEVKTYAPLEISAMILQKMKETAEKFLGCEVKDAVITVPAYFNNAQRQATIDAGKIAGLNVLRIINEPTAAALAYGREMRHDEDRIILIYDFGGGTFDVSIVQIEKGTTFNVLATTGDTHLGGGDIDNLIVEHLIEMFKTKENIDVSENLKARSKLKKSSEEAKHILTDSLNANIEIDALAVGHDFNYTLSRAKFEQLCSDLISSTLVHVERALKDAKLNKDDIEDVVLVGGSTRIPKVKEILQQFFSGKPLKESVNPDEAVAHGAAIQALLLSEIADYSILELTINDVAPLSLGISIRGSLFKVVIPRNTRIPCQKKNSYVTVYDNQECMDIEVYEGERPFVMDNNYLGSFRLEGIPPARSGVGSAEITFALDENGILKVTAVEEVTKSKKSIIISMKDKGLSEDKIEQMIAEATKHKEDDVVERQRVEAKNNLEQYVYRLKSRMSDADCEMTEEEKFEASRYADDAMRWLEENCRLVTGNDIQEILFELREQCSQFGNNQDEEAPEEEVKMLAGPEL